MIFLQTFFSINKRNIFQKKKKLLKLSRFNLIQLAIILVDLHLYPHLIMIVPVKSWNRHLFLNTMFSFRERNLRLPGRVPSPPAQLS